MKWASLLWLAFYFSTSLVCGTVNQSCCNQQTGSEQHKSCHHANADQPGKNVFDLCCCKISADIPKTHLENLAEKVFEFTVFHFPADIFVDSSETFHFIQYLHACLGPPGFILHHHFSDAVFSALAPPIAR